MIVAARWCAPLAHLHRIAAMIAEVLIPDSAEAAASFYGDGPGVTIFGGGTILLPELAAGRLKPTRALLLHKSKLDELRVEGGLIRIGAMVSLAAIAAGASRTAPRPLCSAHRRQRGAPHRDRRRQPLRVSRPRGPERRPWRRADRAGRARSIHGSGRRADGAGRGLRHRSPRRSPRARRRDRSCSARDRLRVDAPPPCALVRGRDGGSFARRSKAVCASACRESPPLPCAAAPSKRAVTPPTSSRTSRRSTTRSRRAYREKILPILVGRASKEVQAG